MQFMLNRLTAKRKTVLLSMLSSTTILFLALINSCSSISVNISTPTPSPETTVATASSSNLTEMPVPNTISNSTIPPANFAGTNDGTLGTITNIQGNFLTLTIGQGTVTVLISSDTTVQETVEGTASDLQTGEFLIIIGNPDDNNNIIATSISIQPNDQSSINNQPNNSMLNPNPNRSTFPSDNITRSGGFAPGLSDNFTNNRSFIPGPSDNSSSVRSFNRNTNGDIVSINGDTLTLSNAQGTVTVILNSETVIQKTTIGTTMDLKTGQSLNVSGNKDANGTIVADSIVVQNQRPGGRIPQTQTSQ